jgi:hypothetical protein
MKNVLVFIVVITASVLTISQTNKTGNFPQTPEKRGSTSMREHAAVTFTIKAWNEAAYNEMPGAPKLTRTSVTKAYQGDLTGEGKLEYLMMYRDDGSATIIGLERVVGTIGGRSGSFVLQHSGTFERGIATVKLSVVPGSGTDRLRGLKGEGQFAVGHEPPYKMALDYDFE